MDNLLVKNSAVLRARLSGCCCACAYTVVPCAASRLGDRFRRHEGLSGCFILHCLRQTGGASCDLVSQPPSRCRPTFMIPLSRTGNVSHAYYPKPEQQSATIVCLMISPWAKKCSYFTTIPDIPSLMPSLCSVYKHSQMMLISLL